MAVEVLETRGGRRLDSPGDRCPHRRPFPADFSDCPAYQAIAFQANDSNNRRLHTHLTCRHLEAGASPGQAGRFYARCGLGDATQRLHWAAQVRPERLAVVRALQEEFDRFTDPSREALVEARALAVAAPADWPRRREVDRLLAAYLEAVAVFLRARTARFADVGLPIGPLHELIEESVGAWARGRPGHGPRLDDGQLTAFSAQAEAFLGPRLPAPGQANGAAREVIFDDGVARIARLGEPPRLALSGEVDRINAGGVAAALIREAATAGELTVDLSGVLFCDLAGLRAIARASRRLGAGRRLRLQGVPAAVRRGLEVAALIPMPTLVVADDPGPA